MSSGWLLGAKAKAKKAAHTINGPSPDDDYDGKRHHFKQNYSPQDGPSEEDRKMAGSYPESAAAQGSRQASSRKDMSRSSRSDRYTPGSMQQQQQQYQETFYSVPTRLESQQRSSHFAASQSEYDHRQADPHEVIENLQGHLRIHKQEIDRLNKKSAALLGENEKLGEELRVLQENSFNVLTDARLMPLDVNTVNGEIENIRDAIWAVAKTYAAESFADIAAAPEDEQLALGLSVDHVMRSGRDDDGGVAGLADIRHAPRLLLAAIISHSVHMDVLSSPFSLLDDGLDRSFESLRQAPKYERMRRRPNGPQVLQRIFEDISRYDLDQAHKWRSDTLRLLYPAHLDSEAAKNTVQTKRRAISEVAGYLVDCLHASLPPALLRSSDGPTHEPLLSELRQIYGSAGKLSIRLWSQRPALVCQVLSQLAPIPFQVSSPILQAHQLHKLDDPSDHSLDGQWTKIVVHPAILAFGTHEADHYERHQVLAKAVVWLDTKNSVSGGGGLLTSK